MASPSQLSQLGSLGRHEEESGQQAGPTSQGSVAAVGEETIGSVVNTPASSQGSTTALSAEQRRTRQFEASSKLAVLAGTALAFQLARPQTQTGAESDVHMMCAICGMQYDVRDSVTRFNCGHHYHTVCINTWQCHRADRQREEMQRHQQQGQDPWCPICRAPLEVESVWMVDLHKDAVIFRLLEMTGRPAEAWMVAQRDLLEEAHRRCIRLERLYVILDKLEDMITILDLLARLAAVRHARHAAAVAFDSLLESRSTP